jgi:hypothetical protein
MGESRLLGEWLAEEYAGRTWHLQFRVGTDPPSAGIDIADEAERRLARNVNRRVDALIEPPADLVVVEATMFRPTDKIGRLQEYLLLLPGTPEVAPWLRYPLVPVLLTGQDDPVARVLCGRLGIRYVFRPPVWLEEWLAMYPNRRRRAPHSGMVDALAARQEEP